MIQRREHLRFALEARHALGVVSERVGQHFHRDVAAEPGIARAVHLTHAARAEGGGDFVGAQFRTGANGMELPPPSVSQSGAEAVQLAILRADHDSSPGHGWRGR